MVETKLSMKPENLKIGALAIGTFAKKKRHDSGMIFGLVLFFWILNLNKIKKLKY